MKKYGPWAVVTGASDGIGKACAEELAKAGMGVVLVARRTAVLERLADELRPHVDVRVVSADLGTREGVDLVLSETRELNVGLLVAAAGFGTSGAFLDTDVDAEVDLLNVNCGAVLRMAHAFARRFKEREGRSGIVLFSSIVAFQGVAGAANYAASKAYVQTLAEALHLELAPCGIDVVASAPGPVHTGFAARADMRLGSALSPSVVARGTLSALGSSMTVRPGWLSKALELALKVPRWARVYIMRIVMGGMTKHQRTQRQQLSS